MTASKHEARARAFIDGWPLRPPIDEVFVKQLTVAFAALEAEVRADLPAHLSRLEAVANAARDHVRNGECTDMCGGWSQPDAVACACGYHTLKTQVAALDNGSAEVKR